LALLTYVSMFAMFRTFYSGEGPDLSGPSVL
jgi:hypothetical protein